VPTPGRIEFDEVHPAIVHLHERKTLHCQIL
jgi:hypothetical protein